MRLKTSAGLLLILLVTAHCQANVPTYPCHRVATAPVIDGLVADDPAWQTVPAVTGFSILGGAYTADKQTIMKTCWDDEALYVAMICEEPDAAHLAPQVSDLGRTWSEDSVELFFQPDAALRRVFQIGVTAGGARGSGEGNPNVLDCTAAAVIGPDSYSIELRIPWAVLDVARPRNGDTWRAAWCRNILTTISGGDKYTSWPPLGGRFLEPESYAVLRFTDQVLDAAEAQRVSNVLNSTYRGVLLRQLVQLLGQATEYDDILREAAEHPQFRAEARNLIRHWRTLQRLHERAEEASTVEMRSHLVEAQDLTEASYRLKYGYLIARVYEAMDSEL